MCVCVCAGMRVATYGGWHVVVQGLLFNDVRERTGSQFDAATAATAVFDLVGNVAHV